MSLFNKKIAYHTSIKADVSITASLPIFQRDSAAEGKCLSSAPVLLIYVPISQFDGKEAAEWLECD